MSHRRRVFAVPAPGHRGRGLPAGAAGPEEDHVAGDGAAPGRVVRAVRGRVRGRTVRRLGHHGRRHRTSGGAHVVVRRRGHRAPAPRHACRVLHIQRRPGTPASVRPGLRVAVADGHVGQLHGARRLRPGHIAGKYEHRPTILAVRPRSALSDVGRRVVRNSDIEEESKGKGRGSPDRGQSFATSVPRQEEEKDCRGYTFHSVHPRENGSVRNVHRATFQ